MVRVTWWRSVEICGDREGEGQWLFCFDDCLGGEVAVWVVERGVCG